MHHHARLLPVLPAFVLAAGSAVGQFGLPHTIERSDNPSPYGVVTADLDNDGLLDVVVSGRRSAWNRNLGNGEFGDARILPGLNDRKIEQLVAADIDGDGWLDLVYDDASEALPEVTSSLNWSRNLGNGEFDAPQYITYSGSTASTARISVGDINGDGRTDVLLNFISGYGKCLNTASGWQIDWTQTYPGYYFTDTDLGDVDGDGDLDMVAALPRSPQHPEPGEFQVLLNDGTGAFAAPQSIPMDTLRLHRLVLADLNNDGALDIAGMRLAEGIGYGAVTLNDGSGGFGPLQSALFPSIEGFETSILPVDLNGDGVLDLVTGKDVLLFLYNLGNGTFQAPVEQILDMDCASPRAMADLDLDGDLDIITSCDHVDSRVLWHENTGGMSFTAHEISFWGFGKRIATDLDGDGAMELLLLSTERLRYYHNEDGGFAEESTIIQEQPGSGSIWALDIDVDGDIDILRSNSLSYTLWVHMNQGSGEFAAATNILNATAPLELWNGDMDGDGAPDIVLKAENGFDWMRNAGGGVYAAPTTLHEIVEDVIPEEVVIVDLDQDGLMDIFIEYVSDSSSRGFLYLRNDGEEAFETVLLFRTRTYNSLHEPKVLDMDGDTDADIIQYRQAGNGEPAQYQLWLNNGEQVFDDSLVLPMERSYDLVLRDLDADGDMDILAGDTLYLQEAGLSFPFHSNIPEQGLPASRFIACDVNGDGMEDLIGSIRYTAPLAWHKNLFQHPYLIRGNTYYDEDQDGLRSPEEMSFPWCTIPVGPSGELVLADSTGSYTAYVGLGTSTVSAGAFPALWMLTTPSGITVELTEDQPISEGNDFGLFPAVDTSLFTLSMTQGLGPCGDTALLWLSFRNEGTRIEQGTVRLELADAYGYISSTPAPLSVMGNVVTWEFDSLSYMQFGRIEVQVTTPTFGSMNETQTNILSVLRQDNDGNTTDTFSLHQEQVVLCAYDPNDKQVAPRGYGATGSVGLDTDVLDYTIRFQNTGSAPAFNVILRDPLDPSLDRSRFEVTGFSHAPSGVAIEPDGELVVRFENIMLPDSGFDMLGSQGFFRFRIGIQEGLPHLTTIENTADIHFDLNAPVVTNTTLTTLVDCGQWQPTITDMGGAFLRAPFGHAYQWYHEGEELEGDTLRELPVEVWGHYSVAVTSVHGCTATSPAYAVLFASVPEVEGLRMVALPNPFHEGTRVLCDRNLTPAHVVRLIDMDGRVLRTWTGLNGRELIVERDGLAAGLYLLRIMDPDGASGALRLIMK